MGATKVTDEKAANHEANREASGFLIHINQHLVEHGEKWAALSWPQLEEEVHRQGQLIRNRRAKDPTCLVITRLTWRCRAYQQPAGEAHLSSNTRKLAAISIDLQDRNGTVKRVSRQFSLWLAGTALEWREQDEGPSFNTAQVVASLFDDIVQREGRPHDHPVLEAY